MSAPEKVNPQKGPQRQPPQQERKHAPSPGKEDGGLSIVDNPLIGHGAMSVDEAKADGKGLWLKREGQPPAYRNPFMVQMHGDKPVTLPRAEGFPRTVSRPNWMTQAKPKIGQPGDKFEQEADQVAEAVVSGKGKQMTPAPPTAPPTDGGPGTPPVQNSEFSGIQQKAEGDEVQKMDLPGIQQKAEGEEVQKMELPGIQQKAEGEEVQKMDLPGIQQKAEGEEVQRKENGPAEAPDGLGERLASSKGGGEPLAPDTREHMEGAIGADFSGVRVHQGDEAKGMSKDLNAQAFTHGNDIYFNEGKYNPGTTEGDRLLAHELTHTVQQGAAPAVNKKADDGAKSKAQRKPKESADSGSIQRIVEKPKTPPAGGAPTAAPVQPLDISKGFDPTPEIEALFAEVNLNKAVDVPVKIGKLVAGTIKVRQTSRPKGTVKGKYSIEANQGIAYDGLGFFNGIKSMGITPVIAIAKGPVAPGQPIGMYYGFQVGKAVSGNPSAFMEQMKKATEALGMVGFKLPTTSASIINAVEGDTLNFTVSGLKVNVAGYVDGEAEFGKQGENFTFKAGMTVDVKGLAQGKFSIERDKEGRLAGEGEIETQIANLSGKVGVKYLGTGDIQVRGSVGIQSEKFSGSVSLMVADKVTADKMMKAELGLPEVEEEGKKKPDAKAPETKTKQNQAVAIWGEVEAKITPWLTGRAKVGISSEGHVTVIGKIAPPSDVVLMEQNTKKIDLFKVEAKGGYGIPFIGQVGFFVSLGMFIKAGFGPLTLRNIAFEGTYSTDPSVMQNFKITGALNISAFAMIALEVEAGLFLTILGHDIKAGINLTAGAGIKAYAEVQPTFEYQEKAGPGGKVGEAWLRGHFEAAAQLFLKLSGEFFVELDSPWWSPAPDKRWPYPLFDVEYPLGKSMGIGGDVDWLVGSPELPELKFSPVEFDPDKFTSDIMADPPPKAGGGKGGEQNPEGKWEAGGDKKDAKPETKDNPGLKGKKEPAEDVSKMTNDQKFIRACEKIGKIGDDAKSKPLALMQLQEKVKKIQSTYGIQSISIKDKDGEAKVTVKHPGKEKQNTNEKEPIKVRLMTVAEMMKLAEAGKKDLEGKVKAKEDPKAHTMKETDAQAIAEEVKAAHYVFEDVTVAQKGDRWEYVLNLAGKTMAVPGSGVEKEKEGQGKDGQEGAKGVELSPFSSSYVNDDEESHSLVLNKKGNRWELERHSTHQSLVLAYLQDRKNIISGNPALPNQATILKKIDEAIALAEEIRDAAYGTGTAAGKPPMDQKTIEAKIKKLVGLIDQYVDHNYVAVPPFQINPPFSSAKASGIDVKYIARGNQEAGTKADKYNGDLSGALRILQGLGIRGTWVAFHLLNDNVGGKAVDSNLVPTPRTINGDFNDSFEEKFKDLYREDDPNTGMPKVLYLLVQVSYHSEMGGIFVKSIKASGGTMKPVKGEYKPSNKEKVPSWNPGTIDLPKPEYVYVNFLPPQESARHTFFADFNLDNALIDMIFEFSERQRRKGLRISHIDEIIGYIRGQVNVKGTQTRYINQLRGGEGKIQFGNPPD